MILINDICYIQNTCNAELALNHLVLTILLTLDADCSITLTGSHKMSMM